MTLTGVRPTGTLATIAKAIRLDPAGGRELLFLAMHDTLDDIVTSRDEEITKALTEDLELIRRAVIRSYITKRAAGEDVAELLAAADRIGVTTIAKNDPGTPYERETGQAQPRGSKGRWIKFLTGATTTVTTPDGTETKTHTPGLVDMFRTPQTEDGKPAKVSSAAYLLGENASTPDRAVYRQLRAGGRVAAAAGSPGSATQLLGITARSIGEIGPEAERVLGENIRRTAYRYRGTERRPDRRFVTEVHDAAAVGQHLSVDGNLPPSLANRGYQLHEEWAVAGARRPGATPASVSSAAGALGHHAQNGQLSSDQMRMRAAGDVAVRELSGRVPNLHLAAISLRAGKLPPSVGVIIDADGDLVTEAQGYNGDHYLPFDLRNLSKLHGGQYVRTRTTGGPTDEDIYTALLTGARQIQVVSNSGVFTVEFDPTLRGGRRYNDKAAQMVDRYARLLAELGSGKVLAQELTPDQRQQIRATALRRAGNDPVKAATLMSEETDKAIAGIAFADQNEEELEARARQVAAAYWQSGQTGNKPRASEASAAQVYEDALAEERQKARDAAARVYRLNGEGYNAALTALQQEFPFYVRDVSWEPMQDFLATRKYGLTDRKPLDRVADIGYTERRALTPRRAARPAKATPAAAAAATGTTASATPAAAAVTTANIKLGDTPFGAKFAQSLPAFAKFVSSNADAIGAPDAGVHTYDETEAVNQSPLNWWGWALARHGGAQGVGKWLLNDANEGNLRQFDALFDVVAAAPLADPYLDTQLPELRGLLGKIRTVKDPYAEPEDNPVFAMPEDGDPRPQPITDAIQAANGTPEQAQQWVADNPDLGNAVAELATKNDHERAALIGPQIRDVKALLVWGQKAATDPEHAEDYRPDGLDGVEATDAAQAYTDYSNGMPPPEYRQAAALQQAWTFLRAMELRKLLGGGGPGGAAPFVPGLPGQGSNITKASQTTLVVHQADSPVARGLAARGPRSPATV